MEHRPGISNAAPLESIVDDYMALAQSLVSAEVSNVRQALNSAESSEDTAALLEITRQASAEGASGMVYTVDGWIEAASNDDIVASLRLEIETLQNATEVLRKRNDKAEAKLTVVNGGYAKRTAVLGEQIVTLHSDIDNSQIEQSVYEMLRAYESAGGMDRLESLKGEVERLRKEEGELQRRYGTLVVEKRRALMKSSASLTTES